MTSSGKTTTSPIESRSTAQALPDLQSTVRRLNQQMQVLVQAIDELTDEVQWRNNNEREASAPPLAVHSLPRDPCTDDWRINRVRPVESPSEAEPPLEAEPPISAATDEPVKPSDCLFG